MASPPGFRRRLRLARSPGSRAALPGSDSARSRRSAVVGGAAALVALVGANIATGRALAASPRVTRCETEIIDRLQQARGPLARRAARAISTASDVPASIAHGALAVGLIGWRTRDWRTAAVPAAALLAETGVYLTAGALVGRPRPDVPRLDRDQPTSSFPSGHQGAAVALMVVYAGLARSLDDPRARAVALAGCLSYPVAVAWSRVYVGMHYPSDVAVGTVNGIACGLLATRWLGPTTPTE